jgi:hypothetical protein
VPWRPAAASAATQIRSSPPTLQLPLTNAVQHGRDSPIRTKVWKERLKYQANPASAEHVEPAGIISKSYLAPVSCLAPAVVWRPRFDRLASPRHARPREGQQLGSSLREIKLTAQCNPQNPAGLDWLSLGHFVRSILDRSALPSERQKRASQARGIKDTHAICPCFLQADEPAGLSFLAGRHPSPHSNLTCPPGGG